jgi:serine phosphatase RsbU (regulator of sigma subunit)
VLYTDGIIETEGDTARGIEEYGEHRLISQVMECAKLSAAETVAAVFEDVRRFDLRDQQQDDRTLVILKGPR